MIYILSGTFFLFSASPLYAQADGGDTQDWSIDYDRAVDCADSVENVTIPVELSSPSAAWVFPETGTTQTTLTVPCQDCADGGKDGTLLVYFTVVHTETEESGWATDVLEYTCPAEESLEDDSKSATCQSLAGTGSLWLGGLAGLGALLRRRRP